MSHLIDTGGQQPARMPLPPTAAEEFLTLMDLRRRVEVRLDELVVILDGPAPLPLSGLRQASPDVLLFKGGRL